MIFGVCAMTMGVSLITEMYQMSAVIFSIVVGTAIGLAIHFGDKVAALCGQMERIVSRFITQKESDITVEEFRSTFSTSLPQLFSLVCLDMWYRRLRFRSLSSS